MVVRPVLYSVCASYAPGGRSPVDNGLKTLALIPNEVLVDLVDRDDDDLGRDDAAGDPGPVEDDAQGLISGSGPVPCL